MSIPLSFTFSYNDEDYTVEGDYTPEEPSQTSGPVEACYEGSPSEFEVGLITLEGCEYLGEISDEMLAVINQRANDAFAELCKTDAEDFAERNYHD